DVTNLLALFEYLDRHGSHIDLRPVQKEVLSAINGRRDEKDLVLKVSTGAGKTAVALLYLQSHMEKSGKPVVYLCPTVQLVEQVHEEAQKLGIRSVIYPAGEPHPDFEGTRGRAIIICTYDKLFNAKTTFNRRDVHLRPYAIVLDDAHAGVEEIRDAFKLQILEGEVLKNLLELLDAPCRKYKLGLWTDIRRDDPFAAIEVPYWIWEPLLDDIQQILADKLDEKSLTFIWPHIRDILRWCRCIVSGSGIEIIPDVLPIHESAAYSEAEHRLFMSATLADDSVLIRELSCEYSAASNPVLPKSDKGLGERMVLAPSLFDPNLDRYWVMDLCRRASKRQRVVVLASNEADARLWKPYGAKVVLGGEVGDAIKKLRGGVPDSNIIVFVQRYDGVDLPDNACRILVIDGMPYGESIADKYDSSQMAIPGGVRNRLIYRIEQGMGRAVRSHADYAVIILAGPVLANFIAKHEVVEEMNPDTRAQLKLALDLAELARKDEQDPDKLLIDMIGQCLNRDEGWKQYYAENIESEKNKKKDSAHLSMADAERQAFNMALANNELDAVDLLRRAIDDNDLSVKEAGWYLQKVANYMHNVDPGEALEVQRAANKKNNSLLCPPGVTRRPSLPGKFETQTEMVKWFKEFENPNGAIAKIQEMRAQLSYEVSPRIFEKALMELAALLGAKGSRPEEDFNEGPDNLWLWPKMSLVIEAKNRNQKSLHKKDAGQLFHSVEWFKQSYSTRQNSIPIIIAKISVADPKVLFPEGTRVITSEKMERLLNRLEQFYQNLVNDPSLLKQPKEILKLQTSIGISPEQFIRGYTVAVIKSR
ncbi:MAG: DEAD/DEAH box helicase, partial [Gemmatimonadetes bacterium]|nr:DEAD/DEAH box helicase [Gemmatimonadota bacterium]